MQSKHVLRALGLSLMAAFSLAAVMAAGAQAVAGEYKVLGSAALATGATVGGSGGLILILVPALNIEIHCENFSVVSGTIVSGPLGTAKGTLLLKNCTIKQLSPLETSTTCMISNGGANHHITVQVFILSVLHNGVKYLLAEQDAGAVFTKIEFTKGIGCTLPNPVEVTGTYAFETSQTEVVKPIVKSPGTLVANEALQTLLGDELKFGKNRSFIISPVGGTVELAGTDKGCTWGAV